MPWKPRSGRPLAHESSSESRCLDVAEFLLWKTPMARGLSAMMLGSASLIMVAATMACSGTDGISIADPADGGAGAATTTFANESAPPPAVSEPVAVTADAGPMDFDAAVPVPDVKAAPDGGAMLMGSPPPSNPAETFRVDCVAAINRYRASVQRAPLVRWTGAEACVDAQATYDAYYQAPHAAFRRCSEVAQTECPSFPGATPEQALDACLRAIWAQGASSGNVRNLTSASVTHAACGVVQNAQGRYWLVQNYR